MSFNEKLQNLRKEKKLSQEQLADKLEVTRQSVSKWESGQTYPEMDKLLALCKIFNCSLEELTNDEIKDISSSKKSNSLVDSILDIISRTYHYFTGSSAGEITKCIFIMLIVGIVLSLISVPLNQIQYSFKQMIDAFNNTGFTTFVSMFFNIITDIAYYILYILLFVYIFRIGFLDKVSISEKKVIEKEIDDNNSEIKETQKVVENKKEHNYTFFDTLATIAMFFIKVLVACFSFPFLISLVGLFAGFVFVIYVGTKGLFFIGLIIGIIFSILLNILLLEFVFNILFSKKHSYKRMLITLLIGLAGCGIAGGIFTLEISNIEYSNKIPENIKLSSEEKTFTMTDTLFFDSFYVNYEVDNTLNNEVKVKASYYNDFYEVYFNNTDTGYFIGSSAKNINIAKLLNMVINNLKERKLYEYDEISYVNVTIYASEDNIQKLKDNYQNMLEDSNKRSWETQESYYVTELEKYETKVEYYEEKINELTNDKELLQEQIDDYKNRIRELLE